MPDTPSAKLVTVDIQRPIVTVDIVLVTLVEDELRVAVTRRETPPHAGAPALIGGYVWPQQDKDVTASARRILAAKARLEDLFLEQIATFSGGERDPRGWSVSVVYLALVPHARLEAAQAAGGPQFELLTPNQCKGLAFDHDEIVVEAMGRLRSKSAWSTLPAFLLGPVFTLPELKSIYQTVLGVPLNDSAFRRKVMEMRLLDEVAGRSEPTADRKRPAQLYQLAHPTLTAFDRTV